MLSCKRSPQKKLPPLKPLALATSFLAITAGIPDIHAFEIETGNPDLRVRWDNTLKYSAAWRTKSQSNKLTEGQTALNQDDGDRNFNKGLLNSTHKCNAHPCMHFVRRLPAQALARA
jgi:hypothetical protein